MPIVKRTIQIKINELNWMQLLTNTAGWILKCIELYFLLRFSQMFQNSLDTASQCTRTMTWIILWKQPNTFLIQRSEMFCSGKVNHLNLIQLNYISLVGCKIPQEQGGSEDSCSQDLDKHHQYFKCSVMVKSVASIFSNKVSDWRKSVLQIVTSILKSYRIIFSTANLYFLSCIFKCAIYGVKLLVSNYK